jgi:hypothetical protein
VQPIPIEVAKASIQSDGSVLLSPDRDEMKRKLEEKRQFEFYID